MRAESLFPRRYCQTFSIGFSSGEYGGSVTSTILSGTVNSRPVACQPAPSHITAATASGATCELISSRCRFMPSILTAGNTDGRQDDRRAVGPLWADGAE